MERQRTRVNCTLVEWNIVTWQSCDYTVRLIIWHSQNATSQQPLPLWAIGTVLNVLAVTSFWLTKNVYIQRNHTSEAIFRIHWVSLIVKLGSDEVTTFYVHTVSGCHVTAAPTVSGCHVTAAPTVSGCHVTAAPTVSGFHVTAAPTVSGFHVKAAPTVSGFHVTAAPTVSGCHVTVAPTVSGFHVTAAPTVSGCHVTAAPTVSGCHVTASCTYLL